MSVDIRWKQRFQNFEKAFLLLEKSLQKKEISEVERAGIIQIFEFTFELAWKTMKDFLEEKNVAVKFPREVIKEAFHYELITNGEIWMDMHEKRNLLAHAYDEEKAALAYAKISGEYFSPLKETYLFFKKML